MQKQEEEEVHHSGADLHIVISERPILLQINIFKRTENHGELMLEHRKSVRRVLKRWEGSDVSSDRIMMNLGRREERYFNVGLFSNTQSCLNSE